MRVSVGEYLAGDVGGTIEFSRSFRNGVQFGVFATFTDVSREDFEKEVLIKAYFLIYQSTEISLTIHGGL